MHCRRSIRLRLRDTRETSTCLLVAPMIIGHHLIWTLYGHWLANDLRGSGSSGILRRKIRAAGPDLSRPQADALAAESRQELKAFHKQAEPLLESTSGFGLTTRRGKPSRNAFAEVDRESRNYTVWACAILSNHAHMVIRRHRDDAIANVATRSLKRSRGKLRQFSGRRRTTIRSGPRGPTKSS